jgi:hypothetical protein
MGWMGYGQVWAGIGWMAIHAIHAARTNQTPAFSKKKLNFFYEN